ncbi:MAG: hypothetical protein HY656_00980 [Acidobacteria bacterium]|nr:hypothetical protein [Acidobacteriota bacterium]
MSLPDAFAGLSFREPARARANRELLKGRLPESLLALLATVLAQVPDADTALNHLERFSRDPGRCVLDALVRQPALLHYLLALFSHSRFLSETLIQQPDLIVWLGRDKQFGRLKSNEDLLEEYARFETAALEEEPALTLARFKRREYLRITLRDILGMAELGETTLELSTLADVLLEKALLRAERELEERYGAPETTDRRGRPVPARFAVVSLGKLGGRELNYSSDVDLLFLYDGEGKTGAPQPRRRIANSEFFIRLAQRLLQLIAGVTRQGPVFRVDLRLRPGGGEGDLAISLPAALDYYQRRAREWELQMLLKARHSAGEPVLVREFLVAVEPVLYRGEMHFAAVESVLRAREEFDQKLDAGDDRLNVKLAPGGIRDIEFLVQCLQRLHGRDDRWVRAPGTLVGLQKLFDKGYLPARDHFRLAAAYQFLRRIEHRLQLEQGQQTHTLPDDAEALGLLARRCGVNGGPGRPAQEEFARVLEGHLQHVRTTYERILPRTPRAGEPEDFALRAPEALAAPSRSSYRGLLQQLRAQGSPLYRALEAMEVSERAQKPLQAFLSAALASSAAFEEVNRAAAALPVGVELLRLSEPLGTWLIRHPERLVELLAVGSSNVGAGPGQLEITLATESAATAPGKLSAQVEPRAPFTRQMAVLRRGFRDAVFRWGAKALVADRPVEESLREFTALAEDVLHASLTVATQHTGGPGSRQALGLAVIALGRLGTEEMDLGSDADLVFVAADSGSQARARRVTERLLHVVSAYTREGTLFPVDVRLRPRGKEGELVETADACLDYFATKAEAWEAVTYLKARPVAGDTRLGELVCLELRASLAQRFAQVEPLRTALREMRQRLEEEAAKTDNFKTGPGGLYDLDFLVSAAALAQGAESLAGRSLREQVERWAPAGAASEEEQKSLQEAARLLRAVDHAIRLATGRATPHLPVGPRAELVAELAGRWLGESFTPGALADRLAGLRAAVRAAFLRGFA